MQEERDYLISKVFPVLKEVASRRNVTVIPIDLRWGITDQEARSGQVIPICLQEIDNSHPFFIGLLGDRYGWCPTYEEMIQNQSLADTYPFVLDDAKNGLSITEIEMQYGVLRHKETINAYFYLKEERHVKDSEKEKLHALKGSVIQDGRYPVANYSSIEALGKLIHDDFIALLDSLYPDQALTRLEKERIIQISVLHSHTHAYIPVKKEFDRLDKFLQSNRPYLVMTGESGVGKSALIANWIQQLDASRFHVIFHFVGSNGQQGTSVGILNHLCDEIRSIYDIDEDLDLQNDSPQEELQVLFYKISNKKPLLIILDGMNQLVETNDAKLLNWLPAPPKNVKMLFSTTANDTTMDSFTNRKYPTYSLKPLSKANRIKFIEEYLRIYRKSLHTAHVSKIAQESLYQNTFILKLFLDELVCFGEHEKIDSKINYYLGADSIEELFSCIIKRFEHDYGEYVRDILSIIACSYQGLNENEIIAITHLSQLHWSQFYCAFKNHFIIQNGLIYFTHPSIVKSILLRDAQHEASYRHRLIDYFSAQQNGSRKYTELPYQYYCVEDDVNLHACISNIPIFHYWYDSDRLLLAEMWRYLLSVDNGKYELGVYLDTNEINAYSNNTLFSILSFIREYFYDFDLCKRHMEAIMPYATSISSAWAFRCYNDLGVIYASHSDYNNALLNIEKAIQILHDSGRQEDSSFAHAYTNKGKLLSSLSRYSEAFACYKKAESILKKNHGTNHPQFATLYEAMGQYYKTQGKYKLALQYCLKSLKIAIQHFGTNSDNVASIHASIGSICRLLGYHLDAKKHLEEALKIYVDIYGVRNSNIASIYDQLGGICVYYQNYSEATTYYNKSLEIDIAIHGEKNPSVASTYSNIGLMLYYQDKDYEAIQSFQKALAIYLDGYGEYSTKTATVQYNMALAEESLYKSTQAAEYLDAALNHYSQALHVLEQIFGKSHMKVAQLYSCIADLYRKYYDDSQQAITYYEKSAQSYMSCGIETGGQDADEAFNKVYKCYNTILDILQQSHRKHQEYIGVYKREISILRYALYNDGYYTYDVADFYMSFANLYYHIENYEKAISYYTTALAIYSKIESSEPKQVIAYRKLGNVYKHIGYTYKAMGRNDLALSNFEKAYNIKINLLDIHDAEVVELQHEINSIQSSICE